MCNSLLILHFRRYNFLEYLCVFLCTRSLVGFSDMRRWPDLKMLGKEKFYSQTKNWVTFNQNFCLKCKLLNANTTQETKMVKGGFAFSSKHYVCDFVLTDVNIPIKPQPVTGFHFVLQSRFSKPERSAISIAHNVFCSYEENSFILMAKLHRLEEATTEMFGELHGVLEFWSLRAVMCNMMQPSYNLFHNLINLHIKIC